MKSAHLNHLRRLNAWVRCEIGQSPEQLRETLQSIMSAVDAVARKDNPDLPQGDDFRGDALLSEGAKERLVRQYDKAAAVPQAVRDAVAAIDAYLQARAKQPEVEAQAPSPKLPARKAHSAIKKTAR